MSKGETAAEPSMDEILSSIRKIIADDEAQRPAGAAVSAATGADDTAAAATRVTEDEDDDILELTEDDEVAENDQPVAGVAEVRAGRAVPSPPSSPSATAALEDATPDMDEAPMERAPIAGAEPEAAATAATPPSSGDAAATMTAMTQMLLDSGSASAASGALQRLSAAMAPGTAIPEGERTIEAFLADLVRPELKAWLDQHLPGLVERIVEREIKRLVRDAQPE
ncbi:MAG: DUF2497 domain-containing protein [Alphaproteobacteria bacterium]